MKRFYSWFAVEKQRAIEDWKDPYFRYSCYVVAMVWVGLITYYLQYR